MTELHPFKRQRLRCGMSIATVASKLGVTLASVNRWESGRGKPRPHIYPRMAKLFRITPDNAVDLFFRAAQHVAA